MTRSSHCGSDTGYRRHRGLSEKPCQSCTEAHARSEKYRAQAAARERHRRAQHGTPEGVKAHLVLRTALCDPCLNVACDIEAHLQKLYLEGYKRRTQSLPFEEDVA